MYESQSYSVLPITFTNQSHGSANQIHKLDSPNEIRDVKNPAAIAG
jgi:hypothetical protein